MKSPLQTVALVIAIVVVLFGVTFVRQYVKSDKITEEPVGKGPNDPIAPVRIYFPVTKVEGHPEWEIHLFGHHDFWFKNNDSQPIEIGFVKKSCRCSKVEVLPMTAPEAERFQHWLATAAVTLALDAPAGLFDTIGVAAAAQEGTRKFEVEHEGWKKLDESKNVIAPAQGAGMVRLTWEGKQIASIRLTTEMWAQEVDNPRTRGGSTTLEAAVGIVPAFHTWPDKLSLPADLQANGQATVETYVWSSTRAGFNVSAHEESNNPCFTCECSPVRGEDFDKVAALLNDRGTTHPLTMYRVKVTVRERVGGHQMDLGPFAHKIILTSDQRDFPKSAVTLAGTVRGDIRVGGLEPEDQRAQRERDKILLRIFRSDRGTTQSVPIETAQAGTKLSVDSVTPSYLEATLNPVEQTESGDRWNLILTVPPNRVTGRLPIDSVVVLKTNNVPPRRIRIPVLGRASLGIDNR
jgi:hypothetical protein